MDGEMEVRKLRDDIWDERCYKCGKTITDEDIHVEVEEHGICCVPCFHVFFKPLDLVYA